jgi:hypothetical protein
MRPLKCLSTTLALLCSLGGTALAACPDLDGDTFCDVSVLRVRLSKNLGTPTAPRGKLGMQGEFFTDPGGGDVFDATGDIILRVTDGLAVDTTFTWTPADCISLTLGRVRCADPTGKQKATFTPIRALPEIVRFKIKGSNLDLQGPFLPPVTARLTHGAGTIRVGVQSECRTSVKGMNCRSL